MSTPRARPVLLAVVPAVLVALSACGPGAPSSVATAASGSAPSKATVPPAGRTAATAPFGAGCAAVPATGAGSVSGLARQPVTAAAMHDLALSSLVAAVTRAQLADSLDSQQNVTLLAPANAAFAAVPQPTLAALLGDTARLTRVLTHHVIEGRLTPEQLAGTHTTLANDTVTITGSATQFAISAGQTLLRAAPATVLCGNIRTANATVYIIDQVLKPQNGG
jgi:uncharacterized surface protein with fasciclin (FAS1) repeats